MNFLWVIFTIVAAAGQTARNAMQRELTTKLGAVGSAHVRFLFGFPFALLFLSCVLCFYHQSLPSTCGLFWLWVMLGALSQIGATALMLMTMEERSFVVSVAYIKTEPLFVAILGLVFLHDRLTLGMVLAVVIATGGVIFISLRPGAISNNDWRPAGLGLLSGVLFGLSAVGYRGAILALALQEYVLSATFTLAVGLVVQACLLTLWLALSNRNVLSEIFRLWRPSLLAGFMGSAASEFWFLAFALATAVSVRTLGLVEVLFAQAVSHVVFKQKTTSRETIGIGLVVGGAALLVYSHG